MRHVSSCRLQDAGAISAEYSCATPQHTTVRSELRDLSASSGRMDAAVLYADLVDENTGFTQVNILQLQRCSPSHQAGC